MMRLTSLAVLVFLTINAEAAANGPIEDFSVSRFLARTSHVDAHAGKSATSTGLIADFWNLDTRVVGNGWILETGYESTLPDDQATDSHSRLWRMATGFYVVHNTAVTVAYDRRDDVTDTRTDRIAIDVTHVQRLKNGMSWSMNGFVAQLKRDSGHGRLDGTDAEVSAGWYFRDNLGIGARFAVGDREGSGDFRRYEAFADYRLTAKASFGVSFVNEHIDDYNHKTGALMLGFRYRP